MAAELAPAPAGAAEKHEALSLKAEPLFTLGKFTVTNSMLVTWVVAAGIIVFAQMATRKIKAVPDGMQNFWEWMVEGLYNFLESVIGTHLVRKTFWFFATIFIFILFLNWFGLIPGVGTVGWGHHDPVTNAFHVDRPLLRGANADLNLTFAMAVVFFALWIVWALQENGFGGFILHLFGPKGDSKGALKILMIIIFFMVGWLEIVSILFRPISLSFRLYGNVYAGENMLESMATSGAGAFLADPDSVLLYGTPGGHRAGAGLHVVDRCLHAIDRPSRTGAGRTPLTIFSDRCGWTTAGAEANQPTEKI